MAGTLCLQIQCRLWSRLRLGHLPLALLPHRRSPAPSPQSHNLHPMHPPLHLPPLHPAHSKLPPPPFPNLHIPLQPPTAQRMAIHPLHNPTPNHHRLPRRLLHLEPPHKITTLPTPLPPPLSIHPSHLRNLHIPPSPHLRSKLPGSARPERVT